MARAVGASISLAELIARLRRRSFAVLSTADEKARPHSVGVIYGVSLDGADLYVMTRRHLKKAVNIAANPAVSVTVPLTRRLLWFLPPACIQFDGVAEILDGTDPGGTAAFERFLMGRRVLAMYRDLERRGDRRTCFIRVTPVEKISTYMVGHSVWELARRMERGAETVSVASPSFGEGARRSVLDQLQIAR